MKCRYCGADLPDDSVFCTQCGARQVAFGQQPYGGYRQTAAPYAGAAETQKNGLATGGMVCSIIGVVMPIGLLSLIGLILSIVGLAQSNRLRSGKGQAIAGVVLGAVGLLETVLMIVFIVAMWDTVWAVYWDTINAYSIAAAVL